MSEPFIAEIRIFGFNFPPKGWAHCQGQLMDIAQNTALFSLIGTYYGGDGRQTMALPDLRGRAPMHPGRGPGLTTRALGEKIGVEWVSIDEKHIPNHTHWTIQSADVNGSLFTPEGNVSARTGFNDKEYVGTLGTNPVDMHPEFLAGTGGGLPHNNMQPYLAINFCIALDGVFPSRS